MKLSKECVNAVYNFIIENTVCPNKDIAQLQDYDTDTFAPQPVLIHKIIKECSEFSAEEIRSALCLLIQSHIINTLENNENGRLDRVELTSSVYLEMLKKFL